MLHLDQLRLGSLVDLNYPENLFDQHHLGSLEGKDKETKAAQRLSEETPESSLIPALELPAAGAVVHGGKVHNHFGPLIVLLAPDGTRLPSETALSQLDAWDVSYKEGQAQWW